VTGCDLEPLDGKECVELLRETAVGRIAFVVDDFPVALPVNYRLVEDGDRVLIVLRTRPGGVIDGAPLRVAFQIDGIDSFRHGGWSVLVRGTLDHLDPAELRRQRERYDPEPWLDDRDSWLVVSPVSITGRRLERAELEWAFHFRAYL
jgi:nitroimidazol reductase NimA-like FMN-containing flavoprotein (pyridoxamine 5'-phosphate oxidase superfamily)